MGGGVEGERNQHDHGQVLALIFIHHCDGQISKFPLSVCHILFCKSVEPGILKSENSQSAQWHFYDKVGLLQTAGISVSTQSVLIPRSATAEPWHTALCSIWYDTIWYMTWYDMGIRFTYVKSLYLVFASQSYSIWRDQHLIFFHTLANHDVQFPKVSPPPPPPPPHQRWTIFS